MTKNPIINAFLGIAYIIVVALLMFYGMEHTKGINSVIVPIAVLSLFSLSAALMGYFLLYQPVLLYLDGKKKQATELFFQTLLVFAVLTAVIFALLISGILR